MKRSVSLSTRNDDFVETLLELDRADSRSAVINEALDSLRATYLADDLELANRQWKESGEAEAWESTIADGLTESPKVSRAAG